MRGLMTAVIGMGVLILVGVTVLVVLMVQRMSSPPPPNVSAVTMASTTTLTDEPAGTHIAALSLSGDRLALQLMGGGPDRVVILDAKTGRIVAKTGLAP